MGLRREMGSFYGWMVRSIKESSLQGLFQGMGFINGMMGECMRENGRRIKWMEGLSVFVEPGWPGLPIHSS